MLDFIRNNTIYRDKYKTHSEAMIVSCFFNPQKSEYRTKAFQAYYDSIKHLNHRIIECVIGDAEPELPENENISRVYTDNLLWHKESLLNMVIKDLPSKYKYVFWVDADVLFTNPNWLIEGVRELQRGSTIIQPFEYCVHLERDETKPGFSMDDLHQTLLPNQLNPKVWRSFAANFATSDLWADLDYNNHGHVGFAWAVRREVLGQIPLFDEALIGGADHIIAHAAAGQINHPCITNAFANSAGSIQTWSRAFNDVAQGRLGFVRGDLYHIWHGDLENRDYFRRIRMLDEQSPRFERDQNGLHKSDSATDALMWNYFMTREAIDGSNHDHHPHSTDGFEGGGGSFGGGGATASWDNEQKPPSSPEGFGGLAGGQSGGAGATGSWPDQPLPPTDTSAPGYTPFS